MPFYWNKATPFYLHIVCGSFQVLKAEQRPVTTTWTTWLAKPKIFTACSLQKHLLVPGLYQGISWGWFNICLNRFGLPGIVIKQAADLRNKSPDLQVREQRCSPSLAHTAWAAQFLSLGFPIYLREGLIPAWPTSQDVEVILPLHSTASRWM